MRYICCLTYTSIHLFSTTTLIFTSCIMDTLIFSLSGCSTAKTKNISYSELRRATNNFHQSNKIGRGGFGIVYKVQLYSINTSLRLYSWSLLHGQLPFAWNSRGAFYRILLPKPLDVFLIICMKRYNRRFGHRFQMFFTLFGISGVGIEDEVVFGHSFSNWKSVHNLNVLKYNFKSEDWVGKQVISCCPKLKYSF